MRNLTVEDYASFTNQSPTLVRKQITEGKLHAIRTGRKYLIPSDAVRFNEPSSPKPKRHSPNIQNPPKRRVGNYGFLSAIAKFFRNL